MTDYPFIITGIRNRLRWWWHCRRPGLPGWPWVRFVLLAR